MKKYLFALLMAFGLISVLTVSCNQEALDMTPDTYSGKEYFKSIFLLQGELTEQIPSLRHFAKYMETESEESIARMVNRINETDPLFFSDLKNAIASKNANNIEAMLDRGNALLEIDVLQNTSISPEVEAQLANLNSSAYDFTDASDVEKFVRAVHGIVNSNSKPLDGPVQEIGQEKCFVVIVVFFWVYTPKRTMADSGAYPGDISNGDSFYKEKLVSEIAHLH